MPSQAAAAHAASRALARLAAETSRSAPRYSALAQMAAADPLTVTLLVGVPPNRLSGGTLWLAALQYVAGQQWPGGPSLPAVGDATALEAYREFVRHHQARLEYLIRTRQVQVNDVTTSAVVTRCLQELSRDWPIVLCEFGCGAGALLRLDQYRYRFEAPDGAVEFGGGSTTPVIACQLAGGEDIATIRSWRQPAIAWRRGIDLIVPRFDDDERRWLLSCLPIDHVGRREMLNGVLAELASDPVEIVRGDAVDLGPIVAAEAPSEAHLVILTAGLMHSLGSRHREFARELIALSSRRAVSWIAVEPDARTTRQALAACGVVASGAHPVPAGDILVAMATLSDGHARLVGSGTTRREPRMISFR